VYQISADRIQIRSDGSLMLTNERNSGSSVRISVPEILLDGETCERARIRQGRESPIAACERRIDQRAAARAVAGEERLHTTVGERHRKICAARSGDHEVDHSRRR
jgi:hypothetical protein